MFGASWWGRTRPGASAGSDRASTGSRGHLAAAGTMPLRARVVWFPGGVPPHADEGGSMRTRLGLTALGAWFLAMVAVISYAVIVDRVGPIEWTGPRIKTTTTIDRPTTTTTAVAAITDLSAASEPEQPVDTTTATTATPPTPTPATPRTTPTAATPRTPPAPL